MGHCFTGSLRPGRAQEGHSFNGPPRIPLRSAGMCRHSYLCTNFPLLVDGLQSLHLQFPFALLARHSHGRHRPLPVWATFSWPLPGFPRIVPGLWARGARARVLRGDEVEDGEVRGFHPAGVRVLRGGLWAGCLAWRAVIRGGLLHPAADLAAPRTEPDLKVLLVLQDFFVPGICL